MRTLKFVDFGKVVLNPWEVACISETDDAVIIKMSNGSTYYIDKHVGEIIVNDRKSVVSALELAANTTNLNDE